MIYIYNMPRISLSCFIEEPFLTKTYAGLEIATDTVANASTTFNLATKILSLVATLATMLL